MKLTLISIMIGTKRYSAFVDLPSGRVTHDQLTKIFPQLNKPRTAFAIV